jgi:EmrB/QacA subfamily drug resistance transporter
MTDLANLGTPTTRSRRPVPSWAVLVIACMAQFMVVLDISIVNVALPAMKHSLDLSSTAQQWIVNAYTLTFGGFLLLGGRAADLFGRKKVFVIGLALFTLASVAGGFAQSGGMLIAARAVQGLGGAILAPATLSLLTTTYTEPKARTRALTAWGATAASGGAFGAVLGGVLTQAFDWRWVLFVNVPIGIVLLIAAVRSLTESRGTLSGLRSLDLPGAITVTTGLAALVYAIVTTDTYSWGSAHTLVLLAVAAVLLVTFGIIESRVKHPLVPLRIFASRSLSGANAIALLLGAVLTAFIFFMSLFIQQVNGYSPLQAGLALLPATLGSLAASLIAGKLVGRVGPRTLLTVGPLVGAGGLLWMAQLSPGDGYLVHILVPSILVGLGLATCFVPMTMAGTGGVPVRDAGLASGLINTSRQVGAAIGLAGLATLAITRTDHVLAGHHAGPTLTGVALTSGYDQAFLYGAGVAVLMAMIAAVIIPKFATHQADTAVEAEALEMVALEGA